jgi:predicted outer membrane protein
MKSIRFVMIALAAAAIIGCDRNRASDTGTASAVGTTGQSDRDKVGRAEKTFVHDMAIANMADVELVKLSPERSTDNDVKKFAPGRRQGAEDRRRQGCHDDALKVATCPAPR